MTRKQLPPPKKGSKNLPSLYAGKVVTFVKTGGKDGEKIPNASLIYGVAAILLFLLSLYYFFTAVWLTAFLVSVLAISLLGYALHYMRYL
ncbi:MAG: hypothetical protein PHW63_03345 [Alphaproteobacteria bacterium]|nr:hypothetical protein [Alphaproteobacteria bacterium]